MIKCASGSAHSVVLSDTSTPMHAASGIAVGQYSGNDRQLSVKSSTDVGERVARFLRSRYQQKTSEMVAADTGIAAATIGKWLERASVPGGLALIALTTAYGPEFMIAVWPTAPRWLDEAHRTEQRRSLHVEINDCRARLEALGH